MGSTILLWGFGALLAVATVFVWLHLVRLALHGRWTDPRPLTSPSGHDQNRKDDRAE